MDPDKYIGLLRRYGASQSRTTSQYYFKTRKSAEGFINSNELLPYLIMNELME